MAIKPPTDKQTDAIALVLRSGNYLTTAAAHVGVTEKVLNTWLEKGSEELKRRELTGTDARAKRPRPSWDPYVRFHEAISKAMHASEVESVVRIRALSRDKDVPASTKLRAEQFLLERHYPERWGRRIIDVEGEAERQAVDKDGEPSLSELLKEAKGGLVTGTGVMGADECLRIVTSIARGDLKMVKSTARGDLFIQPPTFKERRDAAMAVLGRLDEQQAALDAEEDAANSGGPGVSVWRDENEK